MPLKSLLVAFVVNSVISQLILRHATRLLGSPAGWATLPAFLSRAAASAWIYASVALQVVSYVIWMVIVSRAKLGIATASAGAGFYGLMALSAWIVYGESLTVVQWLGILLVTLGVLCVSQGQI
jgi:drug/metabolite transporter (DMT)-like permease